MSYQDRIVIDAQIRSGKPCIRNTRITVLDLLEYMAAQRNGEPGLLQAKAS